MRRVNSNRRCIAEKIWEKRGKVTHYIDILKRIQKTQEASRQNTLRLL